MFKSKKSVKRSGLTLVELMVVSSTMAISMAAIMPALNNGRTQARNALCASNLKQISGALDKYMNDNGGHYPPFILRKTDGSFNFDTDSWVRQCNSYLTETNNTPGSSLLSKMFFCPLGPVPFKTKWKSYSTGASAVWQGNSHYVTYGYNIYLFDNVYSQAISGVSRPLNVTPTPANINASKTLIIIDNASMHNASTSSGAYPSPVVHKASCPKGCNYVSRNHPNNMANILYGDGHVAPTSRKQIDDPYFDDAPNSYSRQNTKWYREYPWHVAW